MTGLDLEDNQQTLQQESATELTPVVPIIMQEDFLWELCDNTVASHSQTNLHTSRLSMFQL